MSFRDDWEAQDWRQRIATTESAVAGMNQSTKKSNVQLLFPPEEEKSDLL